MATFSPVSAVRHRGVLAVLATTQFLLILDTAIVNVALASIGHDLGFAAEDLTWVVNAYVLAFGGLLLLGGRVADIMGARRIFTLGVVLFTLSSLIGALAPTARWLIAARAIQGVGGALAAPAVLALVMRLYDDAADRAGALGVLAAMAGCGGAAGLILGGTLTQWFGWRAVLLINVPVGVAILLASLALVPADDQPSKRRRFDVAGALTVTAGLTVLVYGVLEGSDAGWGSAKTLLTGVVAGVLLVAFVAVEAAAKVPLVPLSFLRHPAVRSANPVAALLSAAMFPMWFLLALYDQRVLGFSPVRTGMAILPLVGALIVVNILAPRLVARYGARNLTTTGLLVAAAGLAWMSRATLESGYRQGLLVPSLVTGIGFGLSFVPLMTAATTAISVEQSGLASGLVNVSQQMGGALGLAVLMTLASSETHNRADLTGSSALAHGLTTGLLGASVAALAGAAVARLLLRPVRSTTAGTADTPRTSPGLHSVPAGSRETSPAS